MTFLPQDLINSLKGHDGFEEKAFIEAHEEKNRITSIRLNPFKKTDLDFSLGDKVTWCENGFYLSERPSFTHDPLFQAGCYYVQEAGSMFLDFTLRHVLDFSSSLKILDLCAAPGGKSTLINSLLNQESLLVSNEIVKPRSSVLARNLSKWGTKNTIVTNNEPDRFGMIGEYFDAIVVDAPCSGSGLFRKQPEAVNEWSPDQVIVCSQRQKRILADVLPVLKNEGILVYSTCSYSDEENEQIVEWLISEFDLEYVKLPVSAEWGIIESEMGYRFYPHRTRSEGFFCAVLRKKRSETPSKNIKYQPLKITKQENEVFKSFFEPDNFQFFKNGDLYHGMNEAACKFVHQFKKDFFLRKAGVLIGEIKGKDLVPDQELAWSNDLRQVETLELNLEESIKYLKKENFSVAVRNAGFSLVRYKERGLGWAKTLPNRVNNYLPNDLRILN